MYKAIEAGTMQPEEVVDYLNELGVTLYDHLGIMAMMLDVMPQEVTDCSEPPEYVAQ